MKKVIISSMLIMFAFCAYSEARNVYDESGRITIQDNTIRGRRKAEQMETVRQQRLQAAAAAKLDYYQALKSLEKPKPVSNYYQDRYKY